MGTRAEARIRALRPRSDAVTMAMAQLGETMPLDDQRRVEMKVYVVLGIAALSDPALRAAHQRIYAGIERLCASVVASLSPSAPRSERSRATLTCTPSSMGWHFTYCTECRRERQPTRFATTWSAWPKRRVARSSQHTRQNYSQGRGHNLCDNTTATHATGAAQPWCVSRQAPAGRLGGWSCRSASSACSRTWSMRAPARCMGRCSPRSGRAHSSLGWSPERVRPWLSCSGWLRGRWRIVAAGTGLSRSSATASPRSAFPCLPSHRTSEPPGLPSRR